MTQSAERERMKIGTRIRFNKELIEPACGDHPTLLYASKGELGSIVDLGAREGYWVKTDSWPARFGASEDEFDVVEKEEG